MTVTMAPRPVRHDERLTLRGGSATTTNPDASGYRLPEPDRPIPTSAVVVVEGEAAVDDPQLVGVEVAEAEARAYVSALWAEDWDSPEDRVYDSW